jgi:hypothetical protein
MEAGENADDARLAIQKLNEELVERRASSSGRLSDEQDPVIKNLKARIEAEEEILHISNNAAKIASNNIAKVFKLQENADRKKVESARKKTAKIFNIELEAIEKSEAQKLALREALFASSEGMEIEAEQAKHERKFELLREALLNEFITIQEFNVLEEEEEQRHMDKMAEIRNGGLSGIEGLIAASYNKQAGLIAGALGDMIGSMSSSSKEAFEINKALAMSQAVVKGYSAAVSAWDAGMSTGGPWAPAVAAAYTAASIAKTGAQISAISSQSYGGGGGGNSNVGGTGQPAPVAQQQQENSIVNINLEGDTFSRGSVSSLFEQINEGLGDGHRINLV